MIRVSSYPLLIGSKFLFNKASSGLSICVKILKVKYALFNRIKNEQTNKSPCTYKTIYNCLKIFWHRKQRTKRVTSLEFTVITNACDMCQLKF